MLPDKRAAPADLDHVAERFGIGRLADDRGIPCLALGRRPFEQLCRAVDRRPFLVAGDQAARPSPCGPCLFDMARHRGERNRRCRPSCRRRRGQTSRHRRSRRQRAGASRPPRRRPARRRCGRRTSDAGRCRSGVRRGFRCPACRPPKTPAARRKSRAASALPPARSARRLRRGSRKGSGSGRRGFRRDRWAISWPRGDSRKRKACHGQRRQLAVAAIDLQRGFPACWLTAAASGMRTWAEGGQMLDRKTRSPLPAPAASAAMPAAAWQCRAGRYAAGAAAHRATLSARWLAGHRP